MYRIIFNTNSCTWQIQILKYGVFWATLKGKQFTNHCSAEDYVEQVGLSKVYRRQGKTFCQFIMEGGK